MGPLAALASSSGIAADPMSRRVLGPHSRVGHSKGLFLVFNHSVQLNITGSYAKWCWRGNVCSRQ